MLIESVYPETEGQMTKEIREFDRKPDFVNTKSPVKMVSEVKV